jgi:flagellar biosynthesis protein
MSKKKPTLRRAVALRYNAPEDAAPIVVAKGRGRTAEQIIAAAQKNDVPMREDQNLVQLLSALDLEQQIPPEAYQAVAAILAFLYRLKAK